MNLNENKTFYPKVNGMIVSDDCEINLDFETILSTSDDSKKITILSIIQFVFSIIYMIHSYDEFKRINSNVGIAKKVS